MSHPALNLLKDGSFLNRFSFISNTDAIHRAIQSSLEVRSIHDALRSGTLSESMIEQFCSELVESVQFGNRFEYEISLAAIAVAMETRQTCFAKKFVSGLAGLKIAEVATAIRVARCAQRLQLDCSGSVEKTFSVISGDANSEWDDAYSEWTLMPSPAREYVSDQKETYLLEVC